MKNLKFTRFLSLPLCSLMVLGLSDQVNALNLMAQASVFVQFAESDDSETNPFSGNGGFFALGQNTAAIEGQPEVKSDLFIDSYQLGSFTIDPVIATNSASIENITATASSSIEIETINSSGTSVSYDWNFFVESRVDKGDNNVSGSAFAFVNDPLFFDLDAIDTNPIVEEAITLLVESTVSKQGENEDSPDFIVPDEDVSVTFFRDSTLLPDRLFEITISATDFAGVEASVFLNPDPSLSFFTDSTLTTPITASELEDILEDPLNNLGSTTGLLSDLSLFSYTWDISGFDISATDTFGGGGQSSVGDPVSVSVPESSNSLSLLLLGIVGTVLMGKRQLMGVFNRVS